MKDEELDRDEDEAPPVFCLCFFCVLVTGSNFHSQVTAATGNETRSTRKIDSKGKRKTKPRPRPTKRKRSARAECAFSRPASDPFVSRVGSPISSSIVPT